MTFEERYKSLNDQQKQAVDHIDGPLMVIAGPGTGKTELLSMRAANILKQTDTNPENILCLTFTDSGAAAMRSRMNEIIGAGAYKIAVHTFHSFGSEIINQNPEYFYQGANFRPSDDLTTLQILQDIFADLPHSNPLSTKSETGYTYLNDVKTIISELRKNSITSAELINILDSNESLIQKANQILGNIFAAKINKSMADDLEKVIPILKNTEIKTSIEDIKPLAEILVYQLGEAIEKAREENSTKAITSWRNKWMQKNRYNQFELKSTVHQKKLRALSVIYDTYLSKMNQLLLYDFDDMILRVVHSCLQNPELRYNLQEKYQYIMVDEFQDTNLAQMRLIHAIADNPVNEGSPNIMVVGDDDQAIYSFQGADVSNIINFTNKYPSSKLITLTNNYRSTPEILNSSRQVILQGENRLENHFSEINKELISAKKDNTKVLFNENESYEAEISHLVKSIKLQLEQGISANQIAVLARKHDDIKRILPYFAHHDIPVNYENKVNIIDQPAIIWLIMAMGIIAYLSGGKHDEVQRLLPEFLAHEAWKIPASEIFEISLKSHKEKKLWIELMSESTVFADAFNFLIEGVKRIPNQNFEPFLDYITGVDQDSRSPFMKYFFSQEILSDNPQIYVDHLNGLSTLRKKFREYMPNAEPDLALFFDFIELHVNNNLGIYIGSDSAGDDGGVRLLTAHKSKGLEFDTVYIFNAINSNWGNSARSRSRLIGYPENLTIKNAGDEYDERLRLFYVSMTRAKNNLIVSYSTKDKNGKNSFLADFLTNIAENSIQKIEAPADEIAINTQIEWYMPLVKSSTNIREILSERMSKYQLSATHLNNFLDLSRGGPDFFLIHNLLRFPEAKSAHSIYGTAVHSALASAQQHLAAHKSVKPLEDVLAIFENNLKLAHLPDKEEVFYLQKGHDDLTEFLNQETNLFTTSQKSEYDFSKENITLPSSARITGKLDLIDIFEDKTLIVSDFKTGKFADKWQGKDDHEKAKLHRYRQQLLFYKLLADNSRSFSDYNTVYGQLIFVEPDENNKIHKLGIDFDKEEIEHMQKLISAVWKHIVNLDFPDVSKYSPDYKGILAFEDDLIEGLTAGSGK